MDLNTHQKWLADFYHQRGWDQYSAQIGINFMTEEVGELSRAVRTLEIGRDHPGEHHATETEMVANLHEELGDVLDQVLFCASKYGVSADDLLSGSEKKLTKRFEGRD